MPITQSLVITPFEEIGVGNRFNQAYFDDWNPSPLAILGVNS